MKSLYIFCGLITTCTLVNAQDSANIRINQLGYFPLAPKTAIITGPVQEKEFYISSDAKNDTLYKGTLGEEMRS